MTAPAGSRATTGPRRRPRPASVLLSGFGPFAGVGVNPSQQVAQALDGGSIVGAHVHALVLPTEFGAATGALLAVIARHRPQLVLALGVAPSRRAVSVERVALNLVDARIADNAGCQPVDAPVVPGGPAAYFSRLPVKAIVAALQRAGLPAELSPSAGSFVCNHVFYGLMHALRRRPAVRAGFIHLPPAAPKAADGLTLARLEQAVRLALATALETEADLHAPGGRID